MGTVPGGAARQRIGAALVVAGFLLFGATGSARAAAWDWPNSCPGYSQCPEIDFPRTMQTDPDAQKVATGIERDEEAALARSGDATLTAQQQLAVLGKLLVFDRTLSVGSDQACASCHTGTAGFTGGISVLNQSSATFPGAVRARTFNRKPQSMAYAAFAPVLHYRESTGDFVGGNFWDERATGLLTGQPSADQAMQPLTNPAEMALADPACAVHRVAIGRYAGFFKQVWGSKALTIKWPADTAQICTKANDGTNPQPLGLSTDDRTRATSALYEIGMATAAFEASSEISPFSSKFDAYIKGKATLTATETKGLALFRGKAQCDDCHISTGTRPMFTDFTAVNIGIPRNPANPYFHEDVADAHGYVANPAGTKYVDNGLGAFLAGPANPNPQWRTLAADFIGAFQVGTLRNIARKPAAGFTRAYMHNGYFTDLKQIVHFYNTRDVLPRCNAAGQTSGAGVIGVTCWPAPEQARNLDTDETGNLGLTSAEEDAIVAFLGTLTDGYRPPAN